MDTLSIYPTLIINPDSDAPAIVPVEDPVLREAVHNYYSQAPLVFEEMTNVYEPFYRQSNLCALMGKEPEELMAFQLREQRTDVYAALDYFFEHYNKDRPFILAGHLKAL